MLSCRDLRLRSAALGLIAGLVIVPSARGQQPGQPVTLQQPPQPTSPPTPQPGQPVLAQPPQPTSDPPPPWAATLGAGLSLTSGNSETKTFSVSFDVMHTDGTHMMRSTGLYLRGSQNGETSVNRTSLAYRDQFALTRRAFVFGELDYLRDTFKAIEYLVAPTGGAGYKFVDTEPTKLSADGGVGAVIEKDTGLDHKVDAALTASEAFVYQMTATATVKQASTNLWKTSDLGDRLHTFSVGLALRVSERMQVSLDLLDTFKSLPPTPATKKNDVALIAALIVKY